MVSAFQVFKMLFGLIISGFVLYFLVFYAGSYSQTQTESQQVIILKNFEDLAKDVYYTGNPSPFGDFKRVEFSMLSLEIREPEGNAQVVADIGKVTLTVPLFFRPGDELFIDRATMDLGWWEFHVAEAMPETKVIFNPMEVGPESWSYMKEAVRMMPSSIGFEPKVTFGLCDGDVIVEDFLGLCGPSSDPCEKEYFLRISRPDTGMSRCTAQLPEGYILATIARDCSNVQSGACFEPPTVGTGNAHIAGSAKTYLYHDAMDWVALIIGGSRSDIYGFAGENLWRHKNRMFGTEVGLAAEMMAERARMLATAIEDEVNRGGLLPDSQSADCKQLYLDLGTVLDVITDTLSLDDYHTAFASVRQLNEKLAEAEAMHNGLVNKGCEPIT